MRIRLAWLALWLVACGPGGEEVDAPTGSDAPGIDAPADLDAGLDAPPDVPGMDGGASTANIEDALHCGTPFPVGGVGRMGELELHQIDTAAFPDALCNDGSAAILYYRPYRGEANRNRWVIGLRGGGQCSSAETCAARWCSCTGAAACPNTTSFTNFDLNNMSGGGRRGSNPGGILHRDGDPNPLEDYNHVQLIYCSSDSWIGNARAVTYTTTHPIDGGDVTFSMHFLGAQILEADLRTLRQDGPAALVYSLDGAPVTMPDLDEAVEVVVAGDSAGGAGVIHHLDGIAATLREHHVGPGEPEVLGLVDAVVGPDWSRLDWSMSAFAAAGYDTYDEVVTALASTASNTGAFRDESCVAHHASDGLDDRCVDLTHVLHHHVTTPFFVRMALLDGLISENYESYGADPVLGPFTSTAGVPLTFARVLARELNGLATLPADAEEDAVTVVPGVFAPACPDHDTIYVDAEVYTASVDPTGTMPLELFDVWTAWRGGSTTPVVTASPTRADTTCP